MAKKNWIDNVVSFVNPEAGLRRTKARLADQIISERHYEGASKGRRTDGWIVTSTNANEEIRPAIETLRERSRDLTRNNPIAGRAKQVIVSNTIGHGIKTNFVVGETQAKDHNDLWLKWAESVECDFEGLRDIYGLQYLAMHTIVESGAVLVRRVRLTAAERGTVPFKIQLLEPDFIDMSKDQVENSIQGIKFDAKGKVVGYWLFESHPGDKSRVSIKSNLVPASEVKMVFRVDRPGQIHGVPWAHPVMITLKDLDEYLDFTMMKQKVSAAFAAFVHDIEGVSDTTGKKAPVSDKMEPGGIEILPNGKSITFANPPSVGDFDPFVRLNLRNIAIGYGITYEALSSDLSMVNFTSGRMGWLEFQRNIDSWRWHMFIPQFCDSVAAWFIEGATLQGLRKPDGLKVVHTTPKREMLDLERETNALVTLVRGGFKTLPQVHREFGEDTVSIVNEIAEMNKLLDDKQIILDTDPRRTMRTGILQTGINAAGIGKTSGEDNGSGGNDA